MAKGDFGHMIFQHFKGEGFDIWFSNYRINAPLTFSGGSDDPILEFHTQYTNHAAANWNGLGIVNLFNRQYQLTYTPDVDTTAQFPGKPCDTFDIHFYKELLQPYAEYCPRLGHFLEKVEKKQRTNLLNVVRFLSPGMEEAIRAMINYSMYDGLAERFFTSRVHELLVHMVYHIGQLENAPKFDPKDIAKAEQVRAIILSDFEKYHTLKELSQMVAMNDHRLQIIFRHRYGTPVMKFSKEQRLRKAHALLMQTDETLQSVALLVGYTEASNFSMAFKSFFKYSPGEVRKKFRR